MSLLNHRNCNKPYSALLTQFKVESVESAEILQDAGNQLETLETPYTVYNPILDHFSPPGYSKQLTEKSLTRLLSLDCLCDCTTWINNWWLTTGLQFTLCAELEAPKHNGAVWCVCVCVEKSMNLVFSILPYSSLFMRTYIL